MSLIRISIAELESRASTRKPGYIAAVKAAAKLDADGLHLLIESQRLNELRARYTDLADLGRSCCGG